jgi:hypothetical protein
MRTITMIKIGADGQHLPADATDHAAVLLPDHGLMFTARVINAEEAPQLDLEQQCTQLTCAGFTDWTMPEIDQLELIIDRTRHSPALNTDFFLDIPLDWLWSKTPCAWSSKDAAGVSAAAWYVSSHYGHVGSYHRGNGFALAVRRVGQ